MITCPICKYADNPEGAVTCVNCGSTLSLARTLLQGKKTGLLPDLSVLLEPRTRLEVPQNLKRPDIAIFIAEVEEPLVVSLTKDLMLGRFGGVDNTAPANIDLAPFGAMEHGVSRKHALLRRLGPDVVVIDLESTNGTWLNGVPLKPHQPVTLRSGDRLVLARLMLQVYMP